MALLMEMDEPRECKLYLVSPPKLDAAAFGPQLDEALEAGRADEAIASFELYLPDADDETLLATARALMPVCHAHGVVFMLADRADLAEQAGVDGVHIRRKPSAAKGLRGYAGEEVIIGVSCANSQHTAMQAGEDGTNFVVFNEVHDWPDLEMLEWWQRFFVLPCVAEGQFTPQSCGAVVAAGADMIAVGNEIWQHAQGPAAAVKAFYTAMTQALQSV